MKNIIFYFSGTGNSEFIAKAIAAQINNCEVVDISNYAQDSAIEADKVGFVFPVYFWDIPNIMRKFVSSLSVKKISYAFVAVTMGSSSGNSIPQMKNILETKQVKLAAGFEYRMPDNYIIAHSAPNDNKISNMVGAAYAKVNEDIKKIVAKTSNPIKKESALYRIINRHYAGTYNTVDRKFCVSEECNHCGLCEKKCPVNNIELVEGKPVWKHHCECCLKCIQYCPKQVINYGTKTTKRKRYTLNYENFITRLNNK